MKRKMKCVGAVSVALFVFTFGASACGMQSCGGKQTDKPYDIEKRARTGWKDEKEYTYNEYTGQLPDTWTRIATNDATNINLASQMNSSFFEFDYLLNEDGEVVPGAFSVDYSAATKLEDVTAKYVGKYGLTEEDGTEGHHAFAITLRQDLKWDDGTPIKAEDFVYTMEQQLSPNYLFSTASTYYSGNYIIHNAKEYVYQGQSDWFDNDTAGYSYADLDITKATLGGGKARIALTSALAWLDGGTLDSYVSKYGAQYFDVDAYTKLKTLADDKGNVPITASSVKLLGDTISNNAAWGESTENVVNYMYVYYTFPTLSFDKVGYFVGDNEYELVVVMDNTLSPLDEKGKLTYQAAYYLQEMPLVKRDLWERCADKKTKPWKNSYCSVGVANSASWGPYKLTNYQADMTYTLSRNEQWYGYGMDEYADQFQTDKIVCNKITEWSTAWQMFQKGQIDGIGMDPTIAEQYRTSRQAYFTPDTYTFSLNLQSRANNKESNNVMLNYQAFRKAISLCLDRDDFCAKNSPSSLAALGLLNSMYYYDVENGGVYRDTEQGKRAILNAYGASETEGGWVVGEVKYDDIDEATDAVTGYNLKLARELMTQAYHEAKAAGDYTDGESIVLTYGIETQSATTDRVKAWFQEAFNAATVGTPLENKVKIEYFYFSSATWSQQFANGEYDLCFGAWGSAAFNPYYLLGETQISDANRYAQGWDPSQVQLTLTIQGDDTHKGGEYTFNLKQWNSNLQGKSDATVNFSLYPTEDRLTILGALETAVLNAYYSVPVYSRYTANLMGYKCDYNSYDYNTFVGYGGMRYMTYHFDDGEWASFVASKGGTLNYSFGRDK